MQRRDPAREPIDLGILHIERRASSSSGIEYSITVGKDQCSPLPFVLDLFSYFCYTPWLPRSPEMQPQPNAPGQPRILANAPRCGARSP